MDSFEIEDVFSVSPEEFCKAWLDSEKHTDMTGGEAIISGSLGESFEAWGGYITGTLLEYEPFQKMVFSWRTTEFPDQSPDSRLKIQIREEGGGSRVTLIHTVIPEGQGLSYKLGWFEHYFQPMKDYFS